MPRFTAAGHRRVAALLVCLALASCGTPPATPPETAPVPAADSIEQLVERVRSARSPEREVYQLALAQALVDQRQLDRARAELAQLNFMQLDAPGFYRYATLLGELELESANFDAARAALELPLNLASVRLADDALRAAWLLQRVRLAQSTHRHADAVTLLLDREPLLRDSVAIEENNQLLWTSLRSVDLARLAPLVDQHPPLAGWLELVMVYANTRGNLSAQTEAIDAWMARNADHPAARYPPPALRTLLDQSRRQASRVAVLLPLSGSLGAAGTAVLDGLLAAHYDLVAGGYPAPGLLIRDTADADIRRLYNDVVADGAELVVGPLDRQQLTLLAGAAELRVPVLGLNSLPESTPRPANVVGLGLAVEHEAEQAALQALIDGHQRVAVLVSSGSWGERARSAFEQAWLRNGGELPVSLSIPDTSQYAELVRSAFLIDASEQRRSQLQQTLGRSLEFEPRRRRDIDAIFLAGTPQQARQLKPIFEFFFGGDIPVYSPSAIWSGAPNPKLDQDLDQVAFLATPWLLDSDASLRRQLNRWSDAAESLLPLYALGIDAYHLQQRLPAILETDGFLYNGALGRLTLDSTGNIRRELQWATFRDGVPVPLAK